MVLSLCILAGIHYSLSPTFFFVPRFLFPASPSRLLRENWVITSWLNCPKVNPAASKILLPSPRPLKQHAQLCIPQSRSTFKRSGGAAQCWARRNPQSAQSPRLTSQLEERYDFEKMQAPATRPQRWQGEGNWGISGGTDQYMQHISCRATVPELSHRWEVPANAHTFAQKYPTSKLNHWVSLMSVLGTGSCISPAPFPLWPQKTR